VLLLLASACTVTAPVRDGDSTVSGGTFTAPVLFHSVEFLLEIDRSGTDVSLDIDAILYRGEPIVRCVRPSIFEIDGKLHHFEKGAKVFVFAPRPGGELPMNFKELPLVLTSAPQRRFVVSWRVKGPEEVLKFGSAELRYRAGRYFRSNGKALTARERERGLRVSKLGVMEVR
jgi:hypothetical protein